HILEIIIYFIHNHTAFVPVFVHLVQITFGYWTIVIWYISEYPHQTGILKSSKKAGYRRPVIILIISQVWFGYIFNPIQKDVGFTNPSKVELRTGILGQHSIIFCGAHRSSGAWHIGFKTWLNIPCSE